MIQVVSGLPEIEHFIAVLYWRLRGCEQTTAKKPKKYSPGVDGATPGYTSAFWEWMTRDTVGVLHLRTLVRRHVIQLELKHAHITQLESVGNNKRVMICMRGRLICQDIGPGFCQWHDLKRGWSELKIRFHVFIEG